MFSPSLHRLFIDATLADTGRSRRWQPPTGSGRDRVSAGRRVRTDRGPTLRFAGHYAEMVVVMFLGMFVLMAPAGWVLGAVGTSWSGLSPALNVFTMALTMTLPMLAWMRYRGHAWRANLEMATSMLIPTFVVMALLSAGAFTTAALMVPEHAAMLTCMLVAMLLRRGEYSCAAQRDPRSAVTA